MSRSIYTGKEVSQKQIAKAILPPKQVLRDWPPEAKIAVLMMARTGARKLAAAACGRHVNTLRRWALGGSKGNHGKPLKGFLRSWNLAKDYAAEHLEAVAYERATLGPTKDIWYKGERMGRGRGVPSDLLLMFLLKGVNPEKYRENKHIEVEGDILGLKELVDMNKRLEAAKTQAVIGGETVDAEYRVLEVEDG